jgi:hypothetical protein
MLERVQSSAQAAHANATEILGWKQALPLLLLTTGDDDAERKNASDPIPTQ